MKFIVDANLPPKLAAWLRSRGHEAEHVGDLRLLTATDSELWAFESGDTDVSYGNGVLS